MNKHTPGPWKHEWHDGGYEVIARTGYIADVTTSANHIPPELEANARMIAAAPDLLAALRDLEYAVSGNHSLQGMPFFQKASDAARAAIAKAEGR